MNLKSASSRLFTDELKLIVLDVSNRSYLKTEAANGCCVFKLSSAWLLEMKRSFLLPWR